MKNFTTSKNLTVRKAMLSAKFINSLRNLLEGAQSD
jgi:hypothetical protein